MCTEYGVRYTAITDQRSGSPSRTAQHTGPAYTPYTQQRRAIVLQQLCVAWHARARIVLLAVSGASFMIWSNNEKSTTWTPSTLRRSACAGRAQAPNPWATLSVHIDHRRLAAASHAGFELCTYRSFPPPRGSSLGCDSISNCHFCSRSTSTSKQPATFFSLI